jgi:hypothetical protein
MTNFNNAFKGKLLNKNMKKEGHIQLTCNIPQKLWEDISIKAIKTKKKKAELIIQALEDYIKTNK